jgi:hypothetical protein
MVTIYEGQPPRPSSLQHHRQAMGQRQLQETLNQSNQLFGKLFFATLQELNGIRCRAAQQLTVWLNQLPESDKHHISRMPHAHKARLPHKLEIPMEEVKLLVDQMIQKSPQLTRNMHGQVHRLLEIGD